MEITEEEINCAGSLYEVAELISKCERCDLHCTKTKDVPGAGNEKAKVIFIGEAPGKQEDEEGVPFIGAAGKYLTEIIENIGWKREDVFIANVVKHRPPKNRDPLPAETEACWPYLKRQIELINPDIIIFLGRHAMNKFFPELVISEAHGKAFEKEFLGKRQTFLALYHPATASRFPTIGKHTREDFAKIPKLLKKIEDEKSSNNNTNQ